MITYTPCVLLFTKSWTYACIFYTYETCFDFTVGPPLNVGFKIDLEDDAVVWCSDIDPVILED
jgi:hypothetical protein